MFDVVWFVSSKPARNCGPLIEVFRKLGVVAEAVKKEDLYDKIDAPIEPLAIPIMMLLDPDLPEELVDKLTKWRSNLKWYGPGQTPSFIFVIYSGAIEEVQKKWDPNDVNDYDFEEFEGLLSEKIARTKITAAQKLRKNAESGVLVGESEPMKRVKGFIQKVKGTSSNVLVLGETGTGKELVARAIHMHGDRADKPFVVCNAAVLPKELIESQLFGHKKGAFTGADSDFVGAFEQAHKGTIFLDEMGELPPVMQTKFLRFIEDRRVLRIGGTKAKQVDVRVVAATNKNLEQMVKEETFRNDLFFRLNVVSILIPPLKERMEDFQALLKYFHLEFASKSGKVKNFDSKAIEALSTYDWPGNVRELRNVVERGYALSDDEQIHYEELPKSIQQFFEKKEPAVVPEKEDFCWQNDFAGNRGGLKEGFLPLNKNSKISKVIKNVIAQRPATRPEQKRTMVQNVLDTASSVGHESKSPQAVLNIFAKELNPNGNSRFDPDYKQEDRVILKTAIELSDGCIQGTASLMKLVGYERNSSSGFIKNRLGLNKSNREKVIDELSEWYFKNYRS